MRQATWNEMFAPRHEAPLAPEVPQEPSGWRRFFWWEHLVTFTLLGVVFLAVVASVDRARWVDDMPTLFPIAFLGLLMGAALARLRWPEAFVHVVALPVGAAASLGQLLLVADGPTPGDRYWDLHDRMGVWFHIAFTGGISNDDLPFIVLVVPAAWLAAYLSAWAVFRWQNAWLGLIPGGVVLVANLSNLSSDFSVSFVVFLLGGALLITRLHLLERARRWREEGTPYPPFLSLSVLHATFWLGLALLIAAWVLPQANEASALESLWRRVTAPVTERVEGYSRLFISVRGDKPATVHRFDEFVPFLGSIELPETLALEVTTEPLGQPGFLRAQVYDIYTPNGWQRRSQQVSTLGANQITDVDKDVRERTTVRIELTSAGRTGDTVLTIGQPRRVDRPVRLLWARTRDDVTAARAANGLDRGSTYEAVGSISLATEEQLRGAGAIPFGGTYPDWLYEPYTELPPELSQRVRDLAQDLTSLEPTLYDKAVAIEAYLREIPYDLDVPGTPRGRDTVDYFLFDARRGYFDYHASAMVVMLRSIGIPARLAVGYILQDSERAAGADRYRVTEQSAFAWPEVYFPGLGWVEFNPTPDQPPVQRPVPQEAAPASPDEPRDVEGGLGLENLPDQTAAGGAVALDDLASDGSSVRNLWVLLGIVAGFFAIATVAAGVGRHAWVRGTAGLDTPARLWEQTVRLASWARMPPDATQTPREYARSLRDRVPGLDEVAALADGYVRHRFGREAADGAEQSGLEEAWRSVRAALLRRLLPGRRDRSV